MDRVDLGPGHTSWSRLKALRDGNQNIANSADLLMQAIEAAPELDAAMVKAFGIQPIVPPGMTK